MSFAELINKIAKELNFTIKSFKEGGKYPSVTYETKDKESLIVSFNKRLDKLYKVSNIYWFSVIRDIVGKYGKPKE